MAAPTKLSVFNAARVKAGEEVLSDLDTLPDASARAMDAVYEELVLNEIENGAWLFAIKRTALDYVDTDDTRNLPYKYAIPSDCLGIVAVKYLDVPLDGALFNIMRGFFWVGQTADITLFYKYRPDESDWPHRFSSIIVDELTAVSMEVTERHPEAQAMRQGAERKRRIARHSEAWQRQSRPMGEGSIVNRRRGGPGQQGFGLAVGGGVSSGGGSSGVSSEDNDITYGAGTDTVSVNAGDGYVRVDTSAGNRTIIFDYTNTSLRKEVTIQKTTAANVLTINDGTADFYPESTTQRVIYRRTATGLVEIGRSA